LDESKTDEILYSDLIVLNSKSRKIHPIDLSDSDNVIQLGSPFHFIFRGEENNTSNILEIIGDSGRAS
jgi:urease beta subunit